jgi:hypothetical protein
MSAVFPPSPEPNPEPTPEPGGRRAQGFLTASVVLASVALVGGTGTALTLTDNRRSAGVTASLARSAASGTAAPSAVPPHAPSRAAGEPPWAPDSTSAASNPANLGPHRSSTAAPSARSAKRVAASASPAPNSANSAATPTGPVGAPTSLVSSVGPASPTSPASSAASPTGPATPTSSAGPSPRERPRDAASRRFLARRPRDHQDLVGRPHADERLAPRRGEDFADDLWQAPGRNPDSGTSDTRTKDGPAREAQDRGEGHAVDGTAGY